MIPHGSSSTDEAIAESLILQVKAESWDGVFVDVKSGDVIPDKSVLRVAISICSSICGRAYENLFVNVHNFTIMHIRTITPSYRMRKGAKCARVAHEAKRKCVRV